MIKWLKRIFFLFFCIFLILSIIPYFFRVSDYRDITEGSPFIEGMTTEINGIRMHYILHEQEYDVLGNILFIHGLGGSTFSWRYTWEPLSAEGYQILLIDLPAFGYSSRKPGLDHSQTARADILWKLIDEISSEPEKWIIAGHSMGAGTAYAMSYLRPGQTRGLIYIAGALHSNSRSSFPIGTLLAYPPIKRAFQVYLENILADENRIFALLSSAYGTTPEKEAIRGYADPLLLPGTAGALLDMISSFGKESYIDSNDLNIPVFGIWGAKDQWVPLKTAERIRAKDPSFKYHTIEEAGHCPMETHSEEFNKILLDILNSLNN